MVILGIDPGSRKMGHAVIEKGHSGMKYLTSGVTFYDKEKEFIYRPRAIYKATRQLIRTHSPHHIALEALIHVKNVTSLVKLAQARGAIMACFGESYRGKIFEYAPNQIKQMVAGHGHTSKERVEKVLRMILGMALADQAFKTDDESDALAIAVCHAMAWGKSEGRPLKRKAKTLSEAFEHLG